MVEYDAFFPLHKADPRTGRSYFIDFRDDNGVLLEVEWGWSDHEGLYVFDAWEKHPFHEDAVVHYVLTNDEYDRLYEQVVALRPFPPTEQDYDID